MFKCDCCGNCSLPGEKMTLVPVQQRKVSYRERYYIKGTGTEVEPKDFVEGGNVVHDPGGWGHETVREEKRCPLCAKL